jgi:hypothetical protein
MSDPSHEVLSRTKDHSRLATDGIQAPHSLLIPHLTEDDLTLARVGRQPKQALHRGGNRWPRQRRALWHRGESCRSISRSTLVGDSTKGSAMRRDFYPFKRGLISVSLYDAR